MRRSIVLQMRRASRAELVFTRIGRMTPTILREYEEQIELFHYVRLHLRHWAQTVTLKMLPELPERLTASPRDAWRPLISIADACGPQVSELVRDAALIISGGYGENPRIHPLAEIRAVFDTPVSELLLPEKISVELQAMHRKINSAGQLTTRTILENLYHLNPAWMVWVGENGQGAPPR
jgi:hypothetical protein